MTEIRALKGDALDQHLDALARLRIEVFRAWPYLYEGDLAYERDYLKVYSAAQDALLVGAFDGSHLIGAATGTPLSEHASDFAAPLADHGYAVEDVFYCAESVLLPKYRGQGIGHRFFEAREDHARDLGATYSAFCSVDRPTDHPLYDVGYRPLDPFWRKRGYAPLPGAVARFAWRDIGEANETEKDLQMWIRRL